MMMIFNIFSLWWCILLIKFSLSLDCPSNNFVYCGKQGDKCRISGVIKNGYISYGTEGRYNLIPFTNKNSNTFEIDCDDDFGDIYHGHGKYCCYISADTGFDIDNYINGNIYYKLQGDYYDFSYNHNIHTMYYSYDNKYLYRLISNTYGYCTNSFFNDVYRGEDNKWCSNTFEHPSILDKTNWILCSNQNEYCTGLDENAHWIRYGTNNKYYYRLVKTNDGKIPCTDYFFNDPVRKNAKFCWRSQDSDVKFSPGYGYWKQIGSCGNCQTNEYSRKIGIEELSETEMTDSWSTSLTTTLSSEYDYGSVSGSFSLSTTVSNSVTETIKNSFKKSEELEIKFICDKSVVYQWITEVTQSDKINTLKDFSIYSSYFWCSDLQLIPLCPPGYCKDENCQTCTLPDTQLYNL